MTRRILCALLVSLAVTAFLPLQAKADDEEDANVNTLDDDGFAPLHRSVDDNAPQRVLDLLLRGADANVRDEASRTPLHYCAEYGEKRLKIAQALIHAGADVNAKDDESDTPLTKAVRNGKCNKFIDLLLISGARTDIVVENENAGEEEKSSHTLSALNVAVKHRCDLALAEQLVEYGADVNAEDWRGTTPISYAAHSCDLRMLKYLVSCGADAQVADIFGTTPLHFAASRNENPDVIHYLIAQGLDVNAKDKFGNTPLTDAARSNGREIVETLLELGGDMHVVNDRGLSPFMNACIFNDDIAVMDLFIEKGCDLHARYKHGRTILHLVPIFCGMPEVNIGNIIARGLDINTQDNNGRTPLHIATKETHVRTVAFLIANGADVNIKNKYGRTPITSATTPKKLHVLREAGAKENPFSRLYKDLKNGNVKPLWSF